MEPRVVIKTHAGVSHPGLFSILIEKCCYPDKSSPERIVSKRLYNFLEEIREFRLGAKFAVIMAKRFGFLQSNMTWSWRSHVMHAVLVHLGKTESSKPAPYFDLSAMEKIIYLKYYLEADGAMLLLLAKELNSAGKISEIEIGERIHFLFRQIYSDYIDLSPDFRSRTILRERLKKIQKGRYDPQEVRHKIFPHLEPLVHLGLLQKLEAGRDTQFYPLSLEGSDTLATRVIEDELSDFQRMEVRFSMGEYFDVIANLLFPATYKKYTDMDGKSVTSVIYEGYNRIKDSVTGTASIEALSDWTCTTLLAEQQILIPRSRVETLLENAWRCNPDGVRFHVDFQGHRSYVILTEEFVRPR